MGKSAGKIMPLPRGAYDGNATYNILDMVTLDNKLWIATRSGVTGITPSKTATEWMMAVDGTTDVKALETEVDAKFASIDEQFLAKDTQISGLDGRVTAAEGSITNLGGRCDEIDGKFVFDNAPTEGSTKLISSGAAYALTRRKYSQGSGENNYENFDNYLMPYSQSIYLGSEAEQYYNSSGKILHRTMTGEVAPQYGSIRISSAYRLRSDNTDSAYVNEASHLSMNGCRISMNLERDGSNDTCLNFTLGYMATQEDGTYDIGCSNGRFRNIYATTGTIQTSDANDKKNINVVDAELASKIIMGLNPVSFKFIDGTSDRTHYGLIAQEVEELVNGLGIDNKDFAALIKSQKTVRRVEKKPIGKDENGKTKYIEEYVEEPVEGEYVYGLRYDEFTAILIKMCQNLQNEVDDLKARLGGE